MRFFLAAHRVGLALRRVEQPRLLHDAAAVLDDIDVPVDHYSYYGWYWWGGGHLVSDGQPVVQVGSSLVRLRANGSSEFIEFVEWLGQLREQAKANEPDAEKRRALLREALDGFRLLGKVQYPKVWLERKKT